MTKKDIFNRLNELDLDKEYFVVASDASIVCHGIKRDCDNLEIYSTKDFSINDIVVLNKEVCEFDLINGFKFMKIV